MSELRFPAGFLIGASTSAHQTEGGNVSSDWWGYEASGRLAERSGDACDSLHRWREDMQLAADAGLDAYRFSIEWARIEPADGQFSLAMVAHYERMVSFARSLGLAPVVTLHHFTNPAWFSAGGGWLRDDAVERFLRYVDVIAPVIAGAHAVVTINEPNMVAIMHRVLSGDATLATGLGGLLPTPDAAVTSRLIEVHHAVVARVRETHAGVPVGWSVANQTVQWVSGGETAALAYREAVEDVFLRAAAGDDFIGVQAYTRTVIGPSGKVAQDAPVTLTGWEVYPQALAESVRHTAAVIPGVPVLVTENGIATADDASRIAYTSVALAALREVMADGVRVDGYLHWSLLDNYEWGHWGPTFGLIAVDRETFVRTPKPALAWLGALRRG